MSQWIAGAAIWMAPHWVTRWTGRLVCGLSGHRVEAHDHPMLAKGGNIRCGCGRYRLLIPKRLGQ